MPLQYIVDTLDDIPEALRGDYVEKDGKFHLDVEGLPAPEDVTGLKSALGKERSNRSALEKRVAGWEKLGKTPEEISELIETFEAAERKKAEEAGDHQKILKQHQDTWAKTEKGLRDEVAAARASERGAVVGERLTAALGRAGATEEGLELLPDRLAARIAFETSDGKRVLKIMQADGETPMAGSGPDGTATIDDLAKEAVKKYPSLFKGNDAGGGGKQPDKKPSNGGNPGVPKTFAECKTDEQKAAFLKAKREAKG